MARSFVLHSSQRLHSRPTYHLIVLLSLLTFTSLPPVTQSATTPDKSGASKLRAYLRPSGVAKRSLAASDDYQTVDRETDFMYAVVVDAGSSGSRARVYRWYEDPGAAGLPDILEIANFKVCGVISCSDL